MAAGFLNVFVKCRLRSFGLAKLMILPLTRAIFQPLRGQNESGKGRMPFDVSPPLEAAVPQNEVNHRCCCLAPRCRKMRLQGVADMCLFARKWFVSAPGFLLVVRWPARRIITFFIILRDYAVSRLLIGLVLVTRVCSVVSYVELPTASPP